jgi:4-carboxymuconolactone decarboxylase
MTQQIKLLPLPDDQWDESIAHIKREMKGRPLNVHGLMANHPQLLKAWWNFRNYSVQGGDLGPRKAELVILRVALHMKAWYEWASHVERGLDCGLTLKEIERVELGPEATGWETSEALLLHAIDELIANRGLSKISQARLREYYSVTQIMDIIAIHGMYIILGCMINTWGLELDPRVEDKLPASIRKDQFESKYSP